MGAIYRREVGAFFTSSIAYVFLAVFYLAAGYFFFGSSLAMATTDMSNLFSSLFFVITILIPVLTMRLFSEEKKQKTEQGLLTAPVSIGGIVMGKYLAAAVYYWSGDHFCLCSDPELFRGSGMGHRDLQHSGTVPAGSSLYCRDIVHLVPDRKSGSCRCAGYDRSAGTGSDRRGGTVCRKYTGCSHRSECSVVLHQIL